MKLLVFVIAFCSLNSFANANSCPTDNSARCEKAVSCSSFYICQINELNALNADITRALSEVDMENLQSCIESRNILEDMISAHAITIECVDTPDGPQFGG